MLFIDNDLPQWGCALQAHAPRQAWPQKSVGKPPHAKNDRLARKKKVLKGLWPKAQG